MANIVEFNDFDNFVRSGITETAKYKKGQFLFRQGEMDDCFYYLNEGEVLIVRDDRVIWTARPKELIGLSSYFSGSTRLGYSALLSTDATVSRIPASFIEALLQENPTFYLATANMLSRRIDSINQRIFQYIAHNSRGRLVGELLQRARQSRDKLLSMDMDEWSILIGVSVRQMRKTLNELEAMKLIQREKGKIKILDLRGLEIFCASL